MRLNNNYIKMTNLLVVIYILSFILPSGYFFGLPVQKLSFVLLSLGLIINISKIRLLIVNLNWKTCSIFLIPLIIFFLSTFIWFIYGKVNKYEFSGQVLNGIILPFIAFIIIVMLYQVKSIKRNVIYKTLFITILLKIIGKIMIEIIFIVTKDIDLINQMYVNWFNTEVTTMGVMLGNILCIRLMHSGDYLVVISSLYFVISNSFITLKKCNNKFSVILWKITFTLMTFLFVIIVYSRYMIIQYLILLGIIGIFIFFRIIRNNYWSNKTKRVIVTLTILTLLIALILISPYLYQLILQRFFSVDNEISDSIRMEQTVILNKNIMKNPIIGFGFGAYIPEVIRSASNIFSYEKEYLSLLYQTGIIGFFLIIINMFYLYFFHILSIVKNLVDVKKIRLKEILKSFDLNVSIILLTIVNIIFFIIRPFFNPGIFGFNNGVILLSMFIILNELKETGDDCENISSASNL